MSLLLLCIFFPSSVRAGEKGKTNLLTTDSVKIDTAKTKLRDSLATADSLKKKSGDVDSVIYSSGTDSLIFFVNQKLMKVYGKAELKYKTTNLKSERIAIDFVTDNIDAVGLPDSLNKKGKGYPVLMEGSEKYEGERMKYNFKTLRGFITLAGTKTEGTAYSGVKIKKMDKDTYFVQNGIYTTCDADTPHFCFYSNEMKVIQKEQIVAKWIWLEFGGVPFPIPLPFAVFPLQSGRRSGIIAPTFGERAGYGRSFNHFGYYWAMSDYTDINLTGDYYTRGGYGLHSKFNYSKRYDFSGTLEGGFTNLHSGESTDQDRISQKDWIVNWSHNQKIDPTTSFNAHLSFQSSSYTSLNSANISDQLTQNVESRASFSKTWEESGSNLTVNYSRTQNLKSGDITEVLPSVSFSLSRFYPFQSKTSSTSTDTKQKWYELVGFDYSGEFQNNRNKTGSNLDIHGAIEHSLSTSASPKIGFFTISPSINYHESWYNKRKVMRWETYQVEYNLPEDPGYAKVESNKIVKNKLRLVTDEIHQINMVRTYSFSLAASTKFFGMFNSPLPGVEAIRHTVTPSISYNYTPDFSNDRWGYYDSYKDTSGKWVKYDKFQGYMFNNISSGESQSVSFSVGNVFEMKTKADPTDTSSTEKKFTLLNLNASMSYNFAADSMRFSTLSLNSNTNIGQFLSFQGNASFSPYDHDSTKYINKYLIKEGKGFLALDNFGFSLSTSISADKLKGKKDKDTTDENRTQDEKTIANPNNSGYSNGIFDKKDADFTIPWEISLNYSYRYSRRFYSSGDISSSINGNLGFNLTPAWKISVTGSYDFIAKKVAAPSINISRDLHCWLMTFTWNPSGTYSGYSFELKVKAPQLQDLKLTKRDSFYEGR